MVDEFSSFARMPRARLVADDVTECVRHVIFLMRVGHPEITSSTDAMPETAVIAHFDRRLLSQALTNIIKNATEGIAAAGGDRTDEGQDFDFAGCDAGRACRNFRGLIMAGASRRKSGSACLSPI